MNTEASKSDAWIAVAVVVIAIVVFVIVVGLPGGGSSKAAVARPASDFLTADEAWSQFKGFPDGALDGETGNVYTAINGGKCQGIDGGSDQPPYYHDFMCDASKRGAWTPKAIIFDVAPSGKIEFVNEYPPNP